MSMITEQLRQFADAVQKLAFSMPAPNEYTPRFVALANEAIYCANRSDDTTPHLARQSEGVSEEDVNTAYKAAMEIAGESRPWLSRAQFRAALTAVWHNRPAQDLAAVPQTNSERLSELVDLLAAGGCTADEQAELAELLHDASRWQVQEKAEPVEMSPEFTDSARGAIAWVLYHHQGGSSPVGQPLRFALGMGAHERLSADRIADAKRYAAWAGATTEQFHRPPAERVRVPDGMLDRIDAAIQRITDGHAPRRIPADPTDVDLVLAEVRSWLTGQGWPPFWIAAAPEASSHEQSK